MLAGKLKFIRKQAQMSQEQLAERLNVSRQAVAKWETGAGVPDIQNFMALSALFHVSIDELLQNAPPINASQDFLFDSVTEYDIDCPKSYDITLAGANTVMMSSYPGEKVQVRLASDTIPGVQRDFKVKIDDVRQRIDIDIKRFGDMTETAAKNALHIFLRFPAQYVKTIELSGNTETLELIDLEAQSIQFSGKTSHIVTENVSAHVELDCSQDMDIVCHGLSGRLDINQISATSKVTLSVDTPFIAVTKGIANKIFYQKDGRQTDDFSLKGEAAADCGNIIELNGMKSELIINARTDSEGQV
ncbi:MAG TPA: helix-turn-helix transcriptional regulator [Clostridia bacterium]|nr:helix-turn-helix transcriptional regulator [Clostridia bacterium]